MNRSLYLMIGGFLGAGKTTAILKLARHSYGTGQAGGVDHQRPKRWLGRLRDT